MKILIFIGMVIIFISAFFIIFIFDTVVKNQIKCVSGLEEGKCDLKAAASSLVIGIALIIMFLIVDSGILYLIIKSITSSGSSYIAYSV